MTTYLTYSGQSPRIEADDAVIANLVRKGWTITEPPITEEVPPPVVPRWVDFSAVVMSLPAINVMLGAVLQAAPGLAGGMWVGLDKASEGDSRVFLNAWTTSYAMGLLTAELITTVQEIANEYELPEEFIEALEPTQ